MEPTHDGAAGAVDIHEAFRALFEASPRWLTELGSATAAAFPLGEGLWLALLVALIAGIVGERIACWKLHALSTSIHEQKRAGFAMSVGYALFRIIFDLAGVALFWMFAVAALYLSLDTDGQSFATARAILGAVATFRVCMVIVRAILAPYSEGIRPITLETGDARVIYGWVAAFVATYVSFNVIGSQIMPAIETPVLRQATVPLIGLAMQILLNLFVWTNRARLERLFAGPRTDSEPSMMSQLLSQSWPYLFSAWLLLLWANWGYAIFIGDAQREQSTMVSWWVTLLFPAVDRLISAGLARITDIPLLQDSGFSARRDRFISTVQTCVRIILLVVALAALAITWNFAGTQIFETPWGRNAVSAAVDIGVTVLLAYVAYEIVMSLLEKNMPEETDGFADHEGEVGGTGASRQETLAPLLRTVFIITLGIVVILAVLSSLGVQVLPLLAGASILGLAVGFGSQKLVQDVISGVFFLVDDAFRRGEYIDLGTVKGTVEKISVRSMQLRHHNGALHTIPFGEIRHLTNYSRDWVMMKLKLRLSYDTDIERVRKLVKKLGQTLLEDEELGPLFLQPLKSQGVYSMEDDSAMIMRVKFMTRPGDQFEIRKRVYTEIRELFAREGIEFAHRVVSVRVDSADGRELTEEEKRRAAGAALQAGET